jgi:DNA-binding transcriptional LysR family regulator
VRELRGEPESLTVDVVGPGLTPALVLASARQHAPELEFFARFHTGTDTAIPLLLDGRLDVTFGRDPNPSGATAWRTVRHEPIAVLLPEAHPLAALDAVPFAALRGTGLCIRAGNHATPGWEHAVLQLLAPFGVDPTGAHPHVEGTEELAAHIRDRNAPILTMTTQPEVPGAVARPIVEPTPLFPWSMIWRSDANHPGVHALNLAVDELAAAHGWLAVPEDSWLPEPESAKRGP